MSPGSRAYGRGRRPRPWARAAPGPGPGLGLARTPNLNYKVKTGSKSSNPINFGLIRENLNLPGLKNIAKIQL